MTSKTITDRAGDTLRVSTGSVTALPSEVTIKVIENARDRRHVAAVHVDPVILRAALDEVAPAGSYTRTDEPRGHDYTPCTHETDSEHWQARAIKAERERDEWKDSAIKAMADLERAEHPHPLTPDAITDEMVQRGVGKFRTLPTGMSAHARVSVILTAALTEPPARPEGAEELNELIGEYLDSTPGVDDKGMADFLAEHGVRVVGEEQS